MNNIFLGNPPQSIINWLNKPTETIGGKWILFDQTETEIEVFKKFSSTTSYSRKWEKSDDLYKAVIFDSARGFVIPHWQLYYGNFQIDDQEKLTDSKAKTLNVVESGTTNKCVLKWFAD